MTETDRGEWGRLIATRRDQLDLTQEQLAEAAGVSEKTVYNVESGDVVPRAGTLRKLKEALGLPEDIRLAMRFIRNADVGHRAEERQAAAVAEINASTISRRQLLEFAQLLGDALDAGDAGEEFEGSLQGWTEEQLDSLDRILRALLPNAQFGKRPLRNVSAGEVKMRAVASTETKIEGAGEFDDEHID